jgi:rod shape determining protein RodA
MVHLDRIYCYHFICNDLLLEPQYVILIALIIILLVHFKSRLADRNIVLSGILLALISGFVLSVSYVLKMF